MKFGRTKLLNVTVGAVLAWEFFNPQSQLPKFLSYIEDRDLWKVGIVQYNAECLLSSVAPEKALLVLTTQCLTWHDLTWPAQTPTPYLT